MRRAVVAHACPDLSDEDIQRIIAKMSSGRFSQDDSELLKPTILEKIGHNLDSNFDSTIDKLKAQAKKKAEAAPAERVPDALKYADLTGSLTEENGRKYAPQAACCVLSKDDKWHFRWKITYMDKLEAPFSTSAKWSKTAPVDVQLKECRDALIFVLVWAWDQHERMTKERCPHRWAE